MHYGRIEKVNETYLKIHAALTLNIRMIQYVQYSLHYTTTSCLTVQGFNEHFAVGEKDRRANFFFSSFPLEQLTENILIVLFSITTE